MNGSIDMEEQYDKIYRYCYFRLRSREAAEDVTQEAFLRFLGAADAAAWSRESSKSIRSTSRSLPYLYTIARNLCVDEFRRKKTESLPEEEQCCELLTEPDRTEKVVESVLLQNALSRLTEQEREMILLRYVNEEPLSVLCEMYQISRFAAHRRLKLSLKKLREMME